MTPKENSEDKIEEEIMKEEEKRREREQVGSEKGIAAAEIVEEMEQSFIDYAMSVIVDRALPSVEDGLKPVHRRILYAMHSLGIDNSKPTMKSARIVGECFVKNTQILSTRGLIPIQEIKRGGFVYTQKGIGEVIELYEMPEKKLLKLTLSTGISVTGTTSQKFKIINNDFTYSWKDAKDLKEGDFLVIKADYPNLDECVNLKLFGNKSMEFNENIAYFLGQFISDGWIEKDNRICIGTCSRNICERLKFILQKEFNYTANIETRDIPYQSSSRLIMESQIFYLRINNRQLCNFLSSTFNIQGRKAYNKEIPFQVFQSPKKVIYSFLSGLIDGDGMIHNKRKVITYSSISEKLIDNLLLITQQLGIIGKKYSLKMQPPREFNNKVIKSNYPSFHIEFSGEFSRKLALNLNLFEERKKERLKGIFLGKFKKSLFEIVPFAGEIIFSELRHNHLGSGWYNDKEGNKFRLGIKYPTGSKIRYSKKLRQNYLRKSQIIEWNILEKLKKLNSPHYNFLREIIENKIFFIKIKKIEEAMSEKTYDFEVKNEHEFVANGILSHNCMGKFHPHGNVPIYDAMVRMAQPFSLRYPLVHGQGNFGSMDGDSPAADRYTEAKLSKISSELLQDIEKETVVMRPNFDNSIKEPETLPAKLPNLLLNGATGIAVGMATNIPPHNLLEVCEAIIEYINNPDIDIDSLASIVKGPDFPTGGLITGAGIKEMYKTGKGKIVIRSKTSIEEDKKGRTSIIINEIPYMVNKAELVKHIAQLVTEKKIPDISDLRDESSKGKVRIVIELKRDVDPKFTLNKLYKLTNVQTSFDANMLALVGKQPRVMNLKDIISEFVKYRQLIVKKRSQFDLEKAEDRLEIVLGLLIALKQIDEVVAFIKKSSDAKTAHEGLMKKFGLSDRQAKSVLDIRLQQLTHLESDKLKDEEKKLKEIISELKNLLGDEKEILKVIKKENHELIKEYGDERRTRIIRQVEEITEADLIEKKDVAVMITQAGYVKRVDINSYREQKRGGAGVTGAELKDEDFVRKLLTCSTHDYLLFFTSLGRVYWLKANDVPASERQSKGKAIVNVLNLRAEEKVSNVMAVKSFEEGYVMFVTKLGIVKKLTLKDLAKPRSTGVRVINLPADNSDFVINVRRVVDKQEVLLITKKGQAIRFNSDEVRAMGRASYGVKGAELERSDEIVSIESIPMDGKTTILTVTSLGYGKRSALDEYRKTSRGAKGVINLKVNEKTGNVVSSLSVSDKDSVITTTNKGMTIRVSMKDLRVMGRATQGVRVVKLKEGDKVADIVKVLAAEVLPAIEQKDFEDG